MIVLSIFCGDIWFKEIYSFVKCQICCVEIEVIVSCNVLACTDRIKTFDLRELILCVSEDLLSE